MRMHRIVAIHDMKRRRSAAVARRARYIDTFRDVAVVMQEFASLPGGTYLEAMAPIDTEIVSGE